MIGRVLDWFGGFGIVKPLIALVVALFAAATLFYYQADAAKARAERFKAENAVLQSTIDAELVKRKSLALQVSETAKRLEAERASSVALQQEFLTLQDINADLDAEAESLADELRRKEREAGNAVRTFDTRGIR